ncbi:MAG: hypothetical protein Q4D33_00470 [Prevotellaceae bacterium]|nr:hypothetical protein [Prevotellaceae bacterium]
MKELSEEYKRLVFLRYLSRTQNITNSEQLDITVKNMTVTVNLLNDVAVDVSECIGDWKDKENRKPCFGRTTFERIMGRHGNNRQSEIKTANLDRIAKYLGCMSWADLLNHNIEDLEADIISHERDAFISQMCDKENINRPGLRRLHARNVDAGQIVSVCYGNVKRLKLKKLEKGEYRFLVQYSDSQKLQNEYAITIPFFYKGVNIVGTDVSYHNIPINTFYKSGGVIESITVEEKL